MKQTWMMKLALKWKFSVGWILWMSAASALIHFSAIHPWKYAFWVWLPVPEVGLLGYWFGRMDVKREMLNKEIEGLEQKMETFRMRTRFNFNRKEN